MIRLELVDDGGELRVGAAQRGKHVSVLKPVVRVHDPAVVQAVDLQGPEWASRPQRGDLLGNLRRFRARGYLGSEVPAHRKVTAQHLMDELELPVHQHSERGLAVGPGGHVRAVAPAAERPRRPRCP